MRSLLGRHKAFLMVAAIVAAFALLAVGCGSDNKSSSTSTAAPAPAATTPATVPSSKGKTYTVGIDIPFHPIFDYVQAKTKDYFGPKGYTVKFKVLDATTQAT